MDTTTKSLSSNGQYVVTFNISIIQKCDFARDKTLRVSKSGSFDVAYKSIIELQSNSWRHTIVTIFSVLWRISNQIGPLNVCHTYVTCYAVGILIFNQDCKVML